MIKYCVGIDILETDELHCFKNVETLKEIDIDIAGKLILFIDLNNKKEFIGFAINKSYVKIMSNLKDSNEKFYDDIKEEVLRNKYIELQNYSNNNYSFKVVIQNIADYINVIKAIQDDKLIFRGQADEAWKLIPNVFRSTDREDIEKEIYDDLQQWNNENFNSENILQNACNMQHYGLPTRLMDWTTNPLNSLFFATVDMSVKEKNGKVICFSPNIIYDENSDEYKLIRNFIKYRYEMKLDDNLSIEDLVNDLFRRGTNTFFIKTKYFNNRIKNQSGIFSVSIKLKNNEVVMLKEQIHSRIFEDSLNFLKDNINSIDKYIEMDFKENLLKALNSRCNRSTFIEDINQYIELKFGSKDKGDNFKKYLIDKVKEEDIILELNDRSLEDALNKDKLLEIIIPFEIKKDIVNDLEFLGLNSRVIYPDIEGLSMYIKQKYIVK